MIYNINKQNLMKQQAAKAAIDFIEEGIIVGIGTGSTINFFIDQLLKIKTKIKATVASSKQSATKLKKLGFEVLDLNQIDYLSIYIDGADAYNNLKQLTKGGGGALTREKILACAADTFICIVDKTKTPEILGKFPIPVEVIPMARSFVAREIVKLHGKPVYRENYITDNGNIILDIHGLEINEPISFEEKLNNIPGLVTNGLFANRGADKLIIGNENGVEII